LEQDGTNTLFVKSTGSHSAPDPGQDHMFTKGGDVVDPETGEVFDEAE
jgi:hypothetical protein